MSNEKKYNDGFRNIYYYHSEMKIDVLLLLIWFGDFSLTKDSIYTTK